MSRRRANLRPDLPLMTTHAVSDLVRTISASTERPMRLLRWSEVRERVGLSRSTVWRLELAGKFPLHVQISPGRVAWREAEIEDFVTGRWKPHSK